MQLPDSAAVNAWRELARADLRVAQVVAGLEPPEWHLVCFLSQQAGEKALKALLEALRQPVPRSHDLVLLSERLQTALPAHEIAEACLALTAHGVGPRYPGPMGPATGEQAAAALAAAVQVCTWAERQFGGALAC